MRRDELLLTRGATLIIFTEEYNLQKKSLLSSYNELIRRILLMKKFHFLSAPLLSLNMVKKFFGVCQSFCHYFVK